MNTLIKAGAQTADMLTSLTAIDEVNLLSCMQAKNLGTRRTAARLLLQDLSDEREQLKKQYNIDYIISPEVDITKQISRNAGLPGNVKLEGYFSDEIRILCVNIDAQSPLKNRSLKDIKQKPVSDILVVAIVREGKLIIPNGNSVCLQGDDIYIVAHTVNMHSAFEEIGIVCNHAKKNCLS